MVKKTKKYLSVIGRITFIGIILWSCNKDNKCVKSSGNNTIEIRLVNEPFETIELNDKINLIIKQDSIFSMQVEAGANLLPLITTEVFDNQLIIKSDNKCSFLRSYKKPINVYLTTPNLKKINYNGQGDITGLNKLTFPSFEIETNKATGSVKLELVNNELKILQHTGPADFKMVGSTNNLYIYSSGNGWFQLENFVAKDVHVNTSGTGTIVVNPVNSLLVEVYAVGSVYYYGDPILTISQHTGKGEIKKI